MKKLLLLVMVLLVLLAAGVPVFADCGDDDEPPCHPEHIPGFELNNGDGNISNLPIPPGWAEADPPGPNDPND